MLPVETVPIRFVPSETAFCTATAEPRSLKLEVGFWASFLA